MLRRLITAFISATFLFSIPGVGEKREKFSGQLRCLLSQAKADGADLQTWSGKSTRTSLMLSTWSSSCSLASLYFSSYFCISTIEPNLGNVSISKPLLNSKLVCRRILWGVAKLMHIYTREVTLKVSLSKSSLFYLSMLPSKFPIGLSHSCLPILPMTSMLSQH